MFAEDALGLYMPGFLSLLSFLPRGIGAQFLDFLQRLFALNFRKAIVRVGGQSAFDKFECGTEGSGRRFEADPMTKQVSVARAQGVPAG